MVKDANFLTSEIRPDLTRIFVLVMTVVYVLVVIFLVVVGRL